MTNPFRPLAVLLGLAAASVAVRAGDEAAAPAARVILLGGDMDPGRPEAARRLLWETGLNAVRITGGGFGWATQGHAAWAKTLAEHGVKAYLQLGSHYPSADYFGMKDAWLVDQKGQTGVEKDWAIRYDGSAWPMLSYAHQGFRDKLARDFPSYLAAFPPGPHLAGVILHNEPGMHWLQNRVFDYGEPNVAAFRAWLPARHGHDIAALNRRWGVEYAAFADVRPPERAEPDRAGAWMDWRRFQVAQIADFMRWEADLVGRARPDLARTTNLDGPTNNWYALRCADLEAYSRAMDAVGIDIYPSRWTDRAFVPFAMDQLQGVAQGRPAHVLECEVFGDRAEEWKDIDAAGRAALLRSQLWTMLGHGADAILMWGFSRGDNYSITDGEWNPRVLACRDLVAQTRMIGLGGFRRAPSKVAVVVDPDAYFLANAQDGGTLSGGSRLDAELRGFHAAFAEAGYQADVIMAAQLPAAVEKYALLALPASPAMGDDAIALLKAYVEKGGHVVAVAPLATLDPWGGTRAESPRPLGLGGSDVMAVKAEGVPPHEIFPAGGGRLTLFRGAAGQPYLHGRPGLNEALADAAAAAKIAPNFRIESKGPVKPDVSVLVDGDDRLVVVAGQGEKASAVRVAEAVSVEFAGPAPRFAFAFPPTAVARASETANPLASSGPTPLRIVASADAPDRFRVEVGTVDGATPALLINDRAPLLRLQAPAQVAAGEKTMLVATCYNLSDAALEGELELVADGLAARARVAVPAGGEVQVFLTFDAPAAATPRFPVNVRLTTPAGEVLGVPVDLAVE